MENTVLERKWLVLRVLSGKERKVKEYMELELKRNNWQDIVSQILVPTEKTFKIKNGKKQVQERNAYPGYIFVEVDEPRVNGDILATIRNTTGVINFLGGNQPQALRKYEVNRMLGKLDESIEANEIMAEPFIVGETVRIIDGPFNEFNGEIEDLNEEKKKLKVAVKIFGRKQPVELSFNQVEKLT